MSVGRLQRISELMVRYGTRPTGKRFAIFDRETGTTLEADFDTEDMARAGARLQAASDIEALCRQA